jgi:hypothetical protein
MESARRCGIAIEKALIKGDLQFTRYYLMSNYYANNYPATALDFRIAVPVRLSYPPIFEYAGDLFAMGFMDAYRVRKKILKELRWIVENQLNVPGWEKEIWY